MAPDNTNQPDISQPGRYRNNEQAKPRASKIDRLKLLIAAGAVAGTLGGWASIAQLNAAADYSGGAQSAAAPASPTGTATPTAQAQPSNTAAATSTSVSSPTATTTSTPSAITTATATLAPATATPTPVQASSAPATGPTPVARTRSSR